MWGWSLSSFFKLLKPPTPRRCASKRARCVLRGVLPHLTCFYRQNSPESTYSPLSRGVCSISLLVLLRFQGTRPICGVGSFSKLYSIHMIEADSIFLDVMKNEQTDSQFVSGSTLSYRYVTGALTYDDVDWYKVYLYSKEDNYLDLHVGSGMISVDLYNSSNFDVPIDCFQFQRYGKSSSNEVMVPSDGVYYLKVYHDETSTSSAYSFTIGNPKYKLGSYTHTYGPIKLAAQGTWEDTVDLTLDTSIPEKAKGYEIKIGGCSTTVSSKRYFYNEFYHQWVATKSTYSYSLPVTDASLLDQVWGAKLISRSSTSMILSPTMTIKYVAPELP